MKRRYLFEFAVLNNGTVIPNGWWEIVGDRLVNQMGGYHLYTPSPNDIIAEAESYSDLDHSYLLDPRSEYGWISPEGRFYGCDYHRHEDVASFIFRASGAELEDKGWVRIYRNSFDGTKEWYCQKFPTEFQKATLERLGLTA